MKSEKVVLRDLDQKYISSYLELVNSKEVLSTTEPQVVNPKVYTKEELNVWLESLRDRKDRADFAILDSQSDTFIGEVVLNYIQNRRANLRIAILPKYFDCGYGTEAIQKVLKHAFTEMGLQEVYLEVFNMNQRGAHVYQKIGFDKTGEFSDSGFKVTKMLITKEKFLNRC